MNISNEKIAYEQALQTKQKREGILQSKTPYPCKKCWNKRLPENFVIQYMENPWVGKYRYLYECKQCKKERMMTRRSGQKSTLEWAIKMIHKQLICGAKQRNIGHTISEEDLRELWDAQQGKCHYTWYFMQYESMHSKEWRFNDKIMYQVSCDRINNNLGYEKNNIVLCCTIANKMKWTLSESEFFKICSDISKNKPLLLRQK